MAVLSPELRDQAEAITARYPAGRERSAVMPLLYLAQSVEGYVTREALREVADLLGLRTAEVEAVASFYTMLRLRPTGEHVVIEVIASTILLLRGGATSDATDKQPEGNGLKQYGAHFAKFAHC